LGELINILFLTNLNNFTFNSSENQFVYENAALDLPFLDMPFELDFNYVALSARENSLTAIFDGEARVELTFTANTTFATLPPSVHISDVPQPPAIDVFDLAALFEYHGWNTDVEEIPFAGATILIAWYGDEELDFADIMSADDLPENMFLFAVLDTEFAVDMIIQLIMAEVAYDMDTEIHRDGRMIWFGSDAALAIFAEIGL
jgi:hypothetical protein